MVSIGETRKAERADGPATVMAIGTANPPNCVDQSTYTLITTSESPTTSTRLSSRRNSRSFGNQISGEESTIKKRYMHLTEEILKENPNV